MNILDIILYKYPNIQGVTYWNTQYDGKTWKDPYDGLKWENKEIPKPTKDDIASWENAASLIKQKEENNALVIQQLEDIDKDSIRALREDDTTRIQALEQEAVQLRAKLL